jgi:phosphoglycerate-specific signal transduction histidine kinase
VSADERAVPASSDAAGFVRAAEAFASRTFRFREEITGLLEHCRQRGQQQLFDDLVFNAKFITNAFQILRRVGADNADTAKLSVELRDMMEKTTTILRTVVKEMPAERRARYTSAFLDLTHGSLGELTALLAELAWVKNYMLDERRAR